MREIVHGCFTPLRPSSTWSYGKASMQKKANPLSREKSETAQEIIRPWFPEKYISHYQTNKLSFFSLTQMQSSPQNIGVSLIVWM